MLSPGYTCFQIKKELHKRAKLRSTQQERSLTALIEEAVERYLAKEEQRQQREQRAS